MVSNDSKQPKMVLQVSGRVEQSVIVEPERVTLEGMAGERIATMVKIVPQTKDPFNVVQVNAMRGTELAYRLVPSEVDGKKAYMLHVENNKSTPGRYYDKIFLKTDSSVVETITIIVSGNIHAVTKTAQ